MFCKGQTMLVRTLVDNTFSLCGQSTHVTFDLSEQSTQCHQTMFPLTHQVVNFEQQAAYVSSRTCAAMKAWYSRKPVSKEIEEAFVQGIETELVSICCPLIRETLMI